MPSSSTYRSAKVIAFLERAGVPLGGRVLDDGCGGGGMPLSLAEETRAVIGIDPAERFQEAGVRLGRERQMRNLHFALADGMALPFAAGSFDLILSHAVIEHVADAPLYLRECARVLAPGGHMYLSTSPYLSFAGAHLPRLKVPVPLHLLDRPAGGVCHVPRARAPRAVDAQGAGERKLLHQGRTQGRGQRGRSPRKGSCGQASRSDRAGRPPHRSRRAARHGDGSTPSGARCSMGA